MTALAPDQSTTGPLTAVVLVVPTSPATARRRADAPAAEVPAWAQLAAAIIATSLAWFAVILLAAGWGWAAIPAAVLAAAIFGGAVLPDFLGAALDRARTRQEDGGQ